MFSLYKNWHEKLHITENGSHIFLANLFLQQDISSEYVMVDFICMGLLDVWVAQNDNYIMTISGTHWDSNTGPSAYEYSLSVVLLVEISIEYLKIDHILPECAIYLLMPGFEGTMLS